MGQIIEDKSRICQIPPLEKMSEPWHQRLATIMMGKDSTSSWRSTSFFIVAGLLLVAQAAINFVWIGPPYRLEWHGFTIFFAVFGLIMFIGALFSRTDGLVWYKEVARNTDTKLGSTTEGRYTKERFNIAPFWGLFGGMTATMLALWSFQALLSGRYVWGGWTFPIIPLQVLGFAGGLLGILAAVYISMFDHKERPIERASV